MEDHSGDRKVGILRNGTLRNGFLIKIDDSRTGREGIPKDPQGAPRGISESFQPGSKVFINDRFYSIKTQKCFYRVFKLSEINLERPGKRFVRHFATF